METLTLNDGTLLSDSSAHQDDARLYVYIRSGAGLQEVFNLLIDPEKTERIVMNAPDFERIFEGFTKMTAVTDEGNGMITAVLKK